MLQQLFEQRQGQAFTGRTISRRRERQTGQTRQRRARDIAMKDLQQENVHGVHRAKHPVATHIVQVTANLENGFRGDRLAYIGLEPRAIASKPPPDYSADGLTWSRG